VSLKSRIETVLFVIARSVTIKEIAEILNEQEADIEDAMLELIMDYSSREGALEINDENGYILQVKEDYTDIVEKLCPVELSGAILKTLTIIALKEPIRQTELKEMRGASTYEHISELVKQGFVKRTKDKNGRSFNLHTTPKFHEYFQLQGDTDILRRMIDEDKNLKEN
jgi:segregation and condensation protein B